MLRLRNTIVTICL